MSVEIQARVWKHSQHGGSALLLLIAIADRADDDGFCWPKVETLATKTRMSTRTVQRLLRELEESGELRVEIQAGRNRSNRFWVTVPDKGVNLPPFESVNGDNLPPFTEEPSIPEKVTTTAEMVTSEVEMVTVVSPDTSDTSRDVSKLEATAVASARAAKKPRPRCPFWDAMTDTLGYPIPDAQSALMGRFKNELVKKGFGPEVIPRAAEGIRDEWGADKITLASIHKHWSRYLHGPPVKATLTGQDLVNRGLRRRGLVGYDARRD